MTNHAEDVLFTLLSDTDEVECLVESGMPLECIPTEDARPIVAWCMDKFRESGHTRAPSKDLIREVWGDRLEDLEIDLGDGTETDTMASVIEALTAVKVEADSQEFVKALGTTMAKADPPEKLKALQQGAETLSALALQYERRGSVITMVDGGASALRRYDHRAEHGVHIEGLQFGLHQVDNHYYGIHPGELAVLAAGPKVGKSWWAAIMALICWRLGMNITLYTLENSLRMTEDRLLCLAAGVPYREFQRGQLEMDQDYRLRQAEKQFSITSNQLHVLSPDPEMRTARAIVDSARLRQADGLIIDQLTFMEHPNPGRKPRHEVIRDILHDLKNALNGRTELPCLLTHQVNREGIKAAEKSGHLEMYHMAEGSEVERTADTVLGLFQTKMERAMGTAKFLGLAARREEPKSWMIEWSPASGSTPRALNEWEPGTTDDKEAA